MNIQQISINFYEENLTIPITSSYSTFKNKIADNFCLDPVDVQELITTFVCGDERHSITNEKDFEGAKEKLMNSSEPSALWFELQVSESSRLFKNEINDSKFVIVEPVVEVKSEEKLSLKEQLEKEIREKEQLLQEMLLKERNDAILREEEQRKAQEALLAEQLHFEEEEERRAHEAELAEELRRKEELAKQEADAKLLEEEALKKEEEQRKKAAKAIEKAKKLAERKELNRKQKEFAAEARKLRAEEAKKFKEEKCSSIKSEVAESKVIEQNLLSENQIQALKDEVVFQINRDITKLRGDLIGKALKQIDASIEKMSSTGQKKQTSNEVHHGYTCDGCGVFPIVGNRYKCTECFNFDLCDNCEAVKDHDHPLVKHKKAINCGGLVNCFRPLQFFKNRGELIAKVKQMKNNYLLADFDEQTIMKVLKGNGGDVDKALEALFKIEKK